jgi:hypothetical protein
MIYIARQAAVRAFGSINGFSSLRTTGAAAASSTFGGSSFSTYTKDFMRNMWVNSMFVHERYGGFCLHFCRAFEEVLNEEKNQIDSMSAAPALAYQGEGALPLSFARENYIY